MTALSAARLTETKNTGAIKRILMPASTTVYAGSLVMRDSAGKAVPAAAGVSNRGVCGVAVETVTSAASGDYYVKVQECWAKFAGSSLAQTMEGQLVYAADDQTVTTAWAANLPIAGRLVEYVSSTVGWVDVSERHPKDLPIVEIKRHVKLATLANGDIFTAITPGFVGFIEKFYVQVTDPATTASKASTLNLEVNTTNLTGGTIALTSANMTPLGVIVESAAITAGHEFDANDTISVEAASTTAFAEGEIDIVIVCRQRI